MPGQETAETMGLDCGDVVVDRDDPAGEAVVVNTPPCETTGWTLRPTLTLAEDNPAYPDDDKVIVVVYRETLEETFPYYCGARPLQLSDLNDKGIKFYAFPESRLKKIDEINTRPVPVSKLRPAPYHSRRFSAQENLRLIARTERDENPPFPPLVQATDDGRLTILDGHKRVWAASVAGLNTIDCVNLYLNDWAAAGIFASCHLDRDDIRIEEDAYEETIRRLHERWGDRASRLPGVPG
jgi:ParB family chromosome partitioning protein